MNWRVLLSWGGIVAGLIILALASTEGRWLFFAACLVLGAAVVVFEIWRAKRRAPFR
jgi:hypothetical protein